MNKTNMILAVLSAALIVMTASTIFLLADNFDKQDSQLNQYDVNLTIFSADDITEITLDVNGIAKSFSFPIGSDFITNDDRFDTILSMLPDNITSMPGSYELKVTIAASDGPLNAFSGDYNILVEVI